MKLKPTTALKLRIGAASLLLLAVLMTFMSVSEPLCKAQHEAELLIAQGSIAALEARLASYTESGLTAAEFESSVVVLDAQIPFSGEYPRCEDGTDPLGQANAALHHTNIKFALNTAMNAEGVASEVADFTKTEAADSSGGSLEAYAVPVSVNDSPAVLRAVIDRLNSDGFLVTSDSIEITSESREVSQEVVVDEATGEVVTESFSSTSMTTSARLLFWYTTTPMFYAQEALAESCTQ